MRTKGLVLFGLLSCFIACSSSKVFEKADRDEISPETLESPVAADEEIVPKTQPETLPDSTVDVVTFFAVGDVLFHTPLFSDCAEDISKCDFGYIFEAWRPDISAADIAVVNQETIFVPRASGYASYPSFGSPEEVGLAEIAAGFDVITHATNHTIDRGSSAVDYTLGFWAGKPATVLGIHATAASADSVTVIEKKGIRFGLVNFTYGLNGQKLPADRPYLVDLLDSAGAWTEKVQSAERASDVTIAFMHFGTEYTELPSKDAVRFAEMAIDAGADILVCAHPHVLEPFGIYTTKAGNRALVYWSLGNFVSNQQQLSTNLGGAAKFAVKRVGRGKESRLEISEATLEGSVTQQEIGNYRAIPLSAYSDSLAELHRLKSKLPEWTLENLQAAFQKNLESATLCGTENPAQTLPLGIVNLHKK